MNEGLKKALALYNDKVKVLKANNKLIYSIDKLSFYKSLNSYECFSDVLTESDFKAVLRHKRNRANRRRRANKKIAKINYLQKPTIVFGTCTFNDEQFFKKNGKPISEERRTRKVNEWIKSHFDYSVVNIDYGKKNEREHHHFVGVLKKGEQLQRIKAKSKTGFAMYELENKDYELGFEPTLELVEYDPYDYQMKRLSNYLLKITSHENKDSTKNRRFRVLSSTEFVLTNSGI